MVNLLDTASIVIPRCVSYNVKGNVISYELHGFADAGKRAYCAMIYLACETSEGIYTTLLSAKTRVAPLKILSIPSLELMAARVLTTLMKTVIKALGEEIPIACARHWLDSKTAL